MKGIKQKVKFSTGERPTDILDPVARKRNPAFRKNPIQCLDGGCEIFITDDPTAVDHYRNIEGVDVLEDEDAIKAAVDAIYARKTAKPVIKSEMLAFEWCKSTGKDLSQLSGLHGQALAERLSQWGAPGVDPGTPPLPPTIEELRERGK